MTTLRLTTSSLDRTATVSVTGDLDVATIGQLCRYMDHVLETLPPGRNGDARLIMRLSGLSFIDATGLGALIAIRNRARRRRTALLLRDVPEAMNRLLTITGLHEQFTIAHPDRHGPLAQSLGHQVGENTLIFGHQYPHGPIGAGPL